MGIRGPNVVAERDEYAGEYQSPDGDIQAREEGAGNENGCRGGEISPGLARQVRQESSDGTVRIWIPEQEGRGSDERCEIQPIEVVLEVELARFPNRD